MAVINRNPDAYQLGTDTIISITAGTIGGFALYAAFGVGIGMLMRNQIGAIVGALAWVLIVEAIFMALVPNIGKWLPGGAIAAMTESRAITGEAFLNVQQGVWLLSAYAVGIAILAMITTNRRDVS
jgi:ABC-2 type transport system permease protein